MHYVYIPGSKLDSQTPLNSFFGKPRRNTFTSMRYGAITRIGATEMNLSSDKMLAFSSHCFKRTFSGRLSAMIITVTLAHSLVSVGMAQRQVVNQVDTVSESVDLYSDRKLSRGVERARERIASGEYSHAIRFLDEVLADPQDSFVSTDDSEGYRGLKATANLMIRDLPPEGIEFYESMFEPLARKKLGEAIEAGNFDDVRKVSQRYFYTSAGFEAALLLAQHEADLGRHMSAVLLYQDLLETPRAVAKLDPQLSLLAAQSWLALGNPTRAESLLEDSRSHSGRRAAPVVVAGSEQRLTGEPLSWFEKEVGTLERRIVEPETDWLLSGGNSTRNGKSEGGLPHTRVRWQARLLNRPQFEEAYEDLVDSNEQLQKPLAPAGSPLAIGNTIVASSAHNVVAFDFRTGKRIWQTQPQRVAEFEQLLSLNNEDLPNDANLDISQAFARRIWKDYLYNSISSDGERVFVIRDLPLSQFADNDIWALPFRGGNLALDSTGTANRLCAYDLATQGKLVWEIDGAARTDGLAGAFFLGTPLAINDKLYCLSEIKSSIHLVAIERHSGKLLWLQQLADLHTGIPLDPLRRLQGAVPSYEAGILVCPTGAGVVIGYNLEKNSIAWHFQYENNRTALEYLRRARGRSRETLGEWIDGNIVLADGRVLLSPPEADVLYCLDLSTGKLLWQKERDGGIYVAGVEKNLVLIVGSENVYALSLEKGIPLWNQKKTVLPNGGSPSGRGFFSSGRYFLPLSNGQVIAIDLRNGDIVERLTAKSETTLGNLISHRGAILSQTGRFLECFDQIEILRRMTELKLAKNSADADALRTLGEITYNEGNLNEALGYLEKADSISPGDLRTNEVLADCLLEAVEKDFARYRDRIPKLRQLLTSTPELSLKLRRLEAVGLLELNQPWESFQVCLEIFNENLSNDELQLMDDHYEASTKSWLKAQIAEIWHRAPSDIKQKVTSQLEKTRGLLSNDPEKLELAEFISTLEGINEMSTAFALEVALHKFKNQQVLAAQQWLLDIASPEGEPADLNGNAIATFSMMLHKTDFKRLARPYDLALTGPLANVECLPGKTGRECVENGAYLNKLRNPDWPYGKVETVVSTPNKSEVNPRINVRSPLTEVRLEHGDNLLSHCNIFYSSRVAELIIRDSLGHEACHHVLGDQERQVFHGGVYGVSRGNLLILSLGQLVVAVNTLAPHSENGASVLWRKRVLRSPSERQIYGGYDFRPDLAHPYSSGTPRMQVNGQWIGVIGPLTRDSFVYQDQRGLHSVDPLTGDARWSRTDCPNACNLFGDDSVVIAVEDSSTRAQIYNTMDGRKIGEVEIAIWRKQVATHGTDVFAWQRTADGGYQLVSVDALSGKTNWKKEFPAGSQIDIAQRRYVAIVDPQGHYQIIDAFDGEVLVDYLHGEKAKARKVYLLAGRDCYVVGVSRPLKQIEVEKRNWFGVPNTDYAAFDGDVMVFEKPSGKPRWSHPAQIRQQALMLSQPMDSPVVSFAGFYRGQDNMGSKPLASLLLLEKASGRVLFADEGMPSSGNLCLISANENAHQVSLDMVGRSVKLQFTDLPRPPEPPATIEADMSSKRGTHGLNRILERFFQGS